MNENVKKMSAITVAGYKRQLKFVAETETKIIISYRSLQFKLGIQMVYVPRFVNARAPFSYEYLATTKFMTSVRFNETNYIAGSANGIEIYFVAHVKLWPDC